jgi:hypothetical protein
MKDGLKNKGALTRGLLTCALLFSFTATFAGEPFAPKVTLPEKMQDREMWLNIVKQWDIPEKEAMAVPAYPGAYVVACIGASSMESNGIKTTTLPAITLATEDDQATVTAFYKEKLAEWNYKNSFDMFDIFWTGQDEFDNLDIRQSATIPNVTVLKATAGQTDFMPKASTAIIIVYKPEE